MKNKLLVSACLMGFQVRYNGSEKAQLAATLSRWQQAGRLVIHCPELAAGLPTPRLPAEILGGTGGDVLAGRARIVESDGRDVTEHYQLAAWLALSAAREAGCQAALLTDGSPTCGSQFVYDGSFRGRRKAGAGVAADLLPRPTASRYFPTGKSRSCSPGWHRRSRMMIQCKRVYDPQESSDGYRVLVDRLWPRGIKKRGAGL
ncbi:Purine nucleoside phosphorylase [Klebsiella pneumoniae]|nr:Purine nucleoside phosphorylase [Klebsiella pneumoniae]